VAQVEVLSEMMAARRCGDEDKMDAVVALEAGPYTRPLFSST